MMRIHIHTLLLVVLLVLLAACSEATISSLEELSYDENHRLSGNYLLYSDTPECSAKVLHYNTAFREKVAISKELEGQFFDGTQSACIAVCLERGTEDVLVSYPMPKHVHKNAALSTLSSWLTKSCQKVEAGFISYHPVELDLYWVSSAKGRVKLTSVKQGEKNTVWQTSYLGGFNRCLSYRRSGFNRCLSYRRSGFNR
jgi:hypothetical protein